MPLIRFLLSNLVLVPRNDLLIFITEISILGKTLCILRLSRDCLQQSPCFCKQSSDSFLAQCHVPNSSLARLSAITIYGLRVFMTFWHGTSAHVSCLCPLKGVKCFPTNGGMLVADDVIHHMTNTGCLLYVVPKKQALNYIMHTFPRKTGPWA